MVGDIIQSEKFAYGYKAVENDFRLTYRKGDLVIDGDSHTQFIYREVSTSNRDAEIIKKAKQEGWDIKEEERQTQEGSVEEFFGKTHITVYVVNEKVDVTCHDESRGRKLYVVEEVKENSNEFYSLGVSELIGGKYWDPNPNQVVWIRVAIAKSSKKGIRESEITHKGVMPFDKVCKQKTTHSLVYARHLGIFGAD
jgi:hypothetical protein